MNSSEDKYLKVGLLMAVSIIIGISLGYGLVVLTYFIIPELTEGLIGLIMALSLPVLITTMIFYHKTKDKRAIRVGILSGLITLLLISSWQIQLF